MPQVDNGGDDTGTAKRKRRKRRQINVPRFSYTLEEATAATGISRSGLYRLIGEGKLTPRKIGGRTLLVADELHALIAGAAERDA